MTAFTYSMAQSLIDRGIHVNCVAPGPIWTPLIPATLPADRVEGFGEQAPAGRAAHPDEIAPSYVFFASERLSSYYTGEVLAPTAAKSNRRNRLRPSMATSAKARRPTRWSTYHGIPRRPGGGMNSAGRAGGSSTFSARK